MSEPVPAAPAPPTVTAEVVAFAGTTEYHHLPAEVVALCRRHILDSLGLMVAGIQDHAYAILLQQLQASGGNAQATCPGSGWRGPVGAVAFLDGLAGHVDDYDDTQLSTWPGAVYGLLTHPSVPVLGGLWPLAEHLGATGRDLITAFAVGTEVECRVADAIQPRHYREGFHSSGTIGTIGAAVAAAWLLRLDRDAMARAIGIAASQSAGLRENFGTMTKSFHVGKAGANGVLAAQLAQRGYTAATNILEAGRGFFQAAGGGFDPERICGRLGRPWFYTDPGVSIKPHPSGSLTHPGMSLMLELIRQHDVRPGDVRSVRVGTNSNMPNALIHARPQNALEAKFSMQFSMAILLLERRAGLAEYRDEVIRRPNVQEMVQKVELYVHPELEALGYSRMRTQIDITLKNGQVISGRGDVARGHPENPMTDAELQEKFRDCCAGTLPPDQVAAAVAAVMGLEQVADVRQVVAHLTPKGR